jgi:aerobic carbon-monoxide dehydrogenase large subunit
MAVEKLKEKAQKIAAHMLGADHSSVVFKEGKYSKEAAKAAAAGSVPEPDVPVGQAPAGALPEPNIEDKHISIQDIALAAHIARELPPGMEPGMSATHFFEPTNFTFPFGTHICVVEIDKDTGDTKIVKYVAVDDCGKVINPMIVEGQIHGGIVQAIGQALYEEVIYDEQGQLITGTLMDYALPKAAMIPHMELDRTETPSPVNPMGVKGVGEAGTIGATPAVVGAVVDALSPFGVRHLDMPLRPERVWQAINQG